MFFHIQKNPKIRFFPLPDINFFCWWPDGQVNGSFGKVFYFTAGLKRLFW